MRCLSLRCRWSLMHWSQVNYCYSNCETSADCQNYNLQYTLYSGQCALNGARLCFRCLFVKPLAHWFLLAFCLFSLSIVQARLFTGLIPRSAVAGPWPWNMMFNFTCAVNPLKQKTDTARYFLFNDANYGSCRFGALLSLVSAPFLSSFGARLCCCCLHLEAHDACCCFVSGNAYGYEDLEIPQVNRCTQSSLSYNSVQLNSCAANSLTFAGFNSGDWFEMRCQPNLSFLCLCRSTGPVAGTVAESYADCDSTFGGRLFKTACTVNTCGALVLWFLPS